MASTRQIRDQPVRLANSLWASSVMLITNLGPVPVWWGDESVEPGRGIVLYPGDQAAVAGEEVYVAAVFDITGSLNGQRSSAVFARDWGAKVALEVVPA